MLTADLKLLMLKKTLQGRSELRTIWITSRGEGKFARLGKMQGNTTGLFKESVV